MRRTLPLVLILLAAAACPAQPRKSPKAKPGAPTVAGEAGKRLDEAVLGFDRESGGFCGSAIVAAKGEVLLEKGYGQADAAAGREMPVDALWDWASVSKQFTAAAVLKLQDMKKLRLDDPLKRFFKAAPKDREMVTLRQLLNHTSGIEAGFKNEWRFDARQRESFEDLILRVPMTSNPGERFEYSNSGYALAAAIVERVAGAPFETFCIENLFRPSGMDDATFIGQTGLPLARVPKIDRGQGFTDRPRDFAFAYGNELTWGYRGCGGTVATTRDMLRWDRALRGKKLLSDAAKKELYAPAKDGYALGWKVRNDPSGLRVEHSGSVLGVVTYYARLIDADLMVALACSYQPKDHPSRLVESLLQIAAKGR